MRLLRVVVVLIFATCLLQSNAQSKSQKELKTVTAGDSITFGVRLDEIPQFSGGQVAVLVCPIQATFPSDESAEDGRQFSRVSSTETVSNQKEYAVSVRIPGDAPDGLWEAFFSFALPNGSFTGLRQASVKFQVRRRQYSGLPTTATITMQ